MKNIKLKIIEKYQENAIAAEMLHKGKKVMKNIQILKNFKECFNCGGLFNEYKMTEYILEGHDPNSIFSDPCAEFLCEHCRKLGIDMAGYGYKKRYK